MEQTHPLRLYRERQAPPLTQDKLAGLLGVSKGTLSRWETGKRKIDHDLLPIVAERTGLAPAELRPDLADLMKQREAAE